MRDRISGIDIGVEIKDDNGKHPIHLNTNDRVVAHFERLRRQEPSFLTRLSNMNLVDHFTDVATFYFAGASEPKKPETLVLIDIDCKKTGTLEGALAFARFLEGRHFPGLYFEPSTHGRGAHGYFVLDKLDYGPEFINNLLLRRLQTWLRQILDEKHFEVENVEIKGTLPVIVWGKEKLEVSNYRSGTLAKLPRLGTPEKEESLRNTTRVTVRDLMRLPVVRNDEECVRTVSGMTVIRKAVGSVSGKVISDDELQKLDGQYRAVADTLLAAHEVRTTGRTVVTAEDIAVFLMLLKFFTGSMNSDGSLPVKRWKALWQALFEAGDIGRAFCPQRFKAIRDYLSSLELLDWKDQTYRIGWYDEDGEYHKGRACKWQASERLLGMLEAAVAEIGEAATKNGRREASFIRTELLLNFQSIVPLPLEQTKRPILIECDAHLRLSPDDLAPLIVPFDAFIGAAA